MRGELLPVWSETWRDIWSKLAKHPEAPSDLFGELYREIMPVLLIQPSAEVLAEIVGDVRRARVAFRKTVTGLIGTERSLVGFLERAHSVAADLGGDPLANSYFVLVEAFLNKFSLRYDLRRPFSLHPTLPGVFARMVSELKNVTRADAHLHQLMTDFEEAIRDLRSDSSSNKIRTCIQRQMNLLEAMGQACPAVTENTLGRICDQLGHTPNIAFPHDRVRDAMKDLYKFACDYPGIRHAGTPGSARRDIDMRDMVAISVLLAGFTPYLSHQVNSDAIYRG